MRRLNSCAFFGVHLPLALLAAGCMHSTMPVTSGERTIIVAAVEKRVGDPNVASRPLPGVDIDLYSADPLNAGAAPIHGMTDSGGSVSFKMFLPLTGLAYTITGKYLNVIQRLPSLLLCRDTAVVFIFDTTTPPSITCAALTVRDTVVFIDERGDTSLVQHAPPGAGRYERCWSVIDPAGSGGPVTITMPTVAAPFMLTAAFVDGAPASTTGSLTLPAGSTLSLCFAVSTADTGVFLQTLSMPVHCASNTGVISLTLRAHVVVPPCTCTTEDVVITHRGSVSVGDSVVYTDGVFTDRSSCPVTVEEISFNGRDGSHAWTVIAPAFPQLVQPGAGITLTTWFAPRTVGVTEDTLVLRVTPEGGSPCMVTVVLSGTGCANACPEILRAGTFWKFGSVPIADTLVDPLDNTRNRIQVSILSVNPAVLSTSDTSYTIRLAAGACDPATVDIDPSLTDSTSLRFFTFSPATASLSPGGQRTIAVHFTAPDVADFRAIVARRAAATPPPHPRTADSAFTLILRLRTSSGCTQIISVTAVITPYPDVSPIINLRAYSQRTPFKASPEDEVYTFGDPARVSLRTIAGDGPYPPNIGDIFINVSDTTAAGVPPLPPILSLRNQRFVGMKLWTTGYAEADFDNVALTVQRFFASAYGTGYGPGPLSPLSSREVYAFQYNTGAEEVYALMYFREVKDGTENNSNKQSAIEFRAIYPVVKP